MKGFIMQHKVIFAEVALVFLLASLLALSGCSSNKKTMAEFVKPSTIAVTAENYVLQPPDEVEIHCVKVPEINMQRQQIRPDGMISFEGLGEIQAAGKTPKELTSLLYEKAVLLYALTGENPIDVRVATFKSSVYYVIGQVYLPGAKEVTGRDTVLTAIAKAQPTNLAWLNNISVIRPSADKTVKPRIFKLKYEKMIAKGNTSKDVLLQEGDIIYIPPTVMAAIGLKLGEFVGPIGQAFTTVNVMQPVH
jgi:protein involved in polysaccharide export with SLBB domain